MPDRLDKLLRTVADSWITELSKVGQIFADLGIGKTQPFTQLARADGLLAFSQQLLQLTQVETSPGIISR